MAQVFSLPHQCECSPARPPTTVLHLVHTWYYFTLITIHIYCLTPPVWDQSVNEGGVFHVSFICSHLSISELSNLSDLHLSPVHTGFTSNNCTGGSDTAAGFYFLQIQTEKGLMVSNQYESLCKLVWHSLLLTVCSKHSVLWSLATDIKTIKELLSPDSRFHLVMLEAQRVVDLCEQQDFRASWQS